MPRLTLPARDRQQRPGAGAERVPPAWSLLASGAFHVLAALFLLLMALFGAWVPPEEPVLRVTLLSEGAGDTGASGGGGGGSEHPVAASAPAAQSAEAEAAPVPETPPSEAAASPAPVKTPAAPAPQTKRVRPQRHRASVARSPAPAPPAPPARPAEPPAQAPAPSSVVAAAGAGTGPGGPEGMGAGAAGAGTGALGADVGPGDDYLERVRRWIKKFQSYPPAAAKQKEEGRVLLHILLARDGTVLDVSVEQSSGFPMLDDAAVKAVHDASPVPPFPAAYRTDRHYVTIAALYEIGFFERLF